MSDRIEKKLKTSKQRNLILCVIRSTHCHPTAYWIFECARKEMPNISLGTIYRNLNLLKEEGKIQELRFGNSVSRYDGDLRSHYHVRCIECGEITDVPHVVPLVSGKQVEELTGYRIHTHHLEFIGLCPDCFNHMDYKE